MKNCEFLRSLQGMLCVLWQQGSIPHNTDFDASFFHKTSIFSHFCEAVPNKFYQSFDLNSTSF